MKDKGRQSGLIAIVAANVIFGLNTPVTRALMADWMTPLGYTVTRMFFGVLVFWFIGLFVRDRKVDKKDLVVMIFSGLIGFIGTQLCFSQALSYTSPVTFSLINALAPVIVLLLSAVFLKEAVPMRKVAGIIISISGAALIISQSGNLEVGDNNSLGILFAFLCVLCYSTYMVMSRNISMKYKPVTVAKWMFLASAVAAVPFSYENLQGQTIFDGSATYTALGLLAFSLVFSTTLAFFLMPYALKFLEASTVSIFMNLQPIVASMVAILVGQDIFSWDKLLAAALVIGGVYIVTTKGKKKKLATANQGVN